MGWVRGSSSSPTAGVSVAIGDRRPHIAALIVPGPGAAALFATQHGIGDPVAGSCPPPIRAVADTAVKTGNGKLSQVEQVQRFAVLPAF